MKVQFKTIPTPFKDLFSMDTIYEMNYSKVNSSFKFTSFGGQTKTSHFSYNDYTLTGNDGEEYSISGICKTVSNQCCYADILEKVK